MVMEATRARPPISVTISTVQGWPDVQVAITKAASSARRAGGDLIVTDGSGLPAPSTAELGADVTWAQYPGESVFQLRERGYRLATGALVAITEDHVHVPEDWVERMVAAHTAHPEAVAIGGSVLNAATTGIMDWASFLIVQAPVAAPIRSGRATRLSGAVNVTYKHAAIEDIESFDGLGAMDGLHQKGLLASGAVLINDDTIRVLHDQSLGFRGTTAIHFHAGRTMSGFRRTRLTAVDFLRIVGAPFVPLARYARTVQLLAPRGYGRLLTRCTPAILWLLYSQGAGQFIGYLAGSGDSPAKVQ